MIPGDALKIPMVSPGIPGAPLCILKESQGILRGSLGLPRGILGDPRGIPGERSVRDSERVVSSVFIYVCVYIR